MTDSNVQKMHISHGEGNMQKAHKSPEIDTSAEAVVKLLSRGWPDCPSDSRDMILALAAKCDAATKALADRNTLFDRMWEADMRGIKAWQEANPGNDLTWPDRGKLVEWLLSERDAATKRADELQSRLEKLREIHRCEIASKDASLESANAHCQYLAQKCDEMKGGA